MATKSPTRLKVLNPPVRRTGVAAAVPQATGDVPQTPYLNLNLPPTGFPSWGPDLNQNFSSLDASVGALQRSYQGDWINNRVYAAGQIVIFEGGVFISLVSGNIGLQPDIHPEAWGPMGSATSITYPPAGIAVSQGSAGWAPSINPATIPPYPNAGIPVSTSTAWAASIPVANIVVTNPTANTIIDYGWNTFRIQGSAPGAVAGNANPVPANAYGQLQGPSGQATTGTTGQIASSGGLVTIAGGDGGIAPVGSTNGGGGVVFIGGGRAGQGAGAAGLGGDVFIQENWGTTYIGGSNTGGRLRVQHGGVSDFFSNVGAGAGTLVIGATGGLTVAWNLRNGVGETDFVNCTSGAGGAFYWYNTAPNTTLTATTPPAMWLDSSYNLHTTGFMQPTGIWAVSPLTASGSAVTVLAPNLTSGSAVSMYIGSQSAPGLIANYGFVYNSAGSAGTIGLVAGGQTTFDFTGNWNFNASVSIWNNLSLGGGALWVGQQIGGPIAGTAELRVDNSLPRTYLDSWGDLFINANRAQNTVLTGTFYATAKNFKITHPLYEDEDLVHSTLEGPELAVFYRGEAETEEGKVEITLPDYFEALTRPENRTVLLTELFEDEDEPVFGNFLAAGRIKNGKFSVRSSTEKVKFFWEVKAVRSDLDQLVITRKKEIPDEHPIVPPIAQPTAFSIPLATEPVGDRTSPVRELRSAPNGV